MADPYLGYITYFAFDFAPKGWMQCNGQLMPIQQNNALYALLSNFYGGDGKTTFALPDLRGRSAIGFGQASSGRYTLGQKAGAESVTLTTANLPAHVHALVLEVPVSVSTADQTLPLDTYLSVPANGANKFAPFTSSMGAYGGLSIQVGSAGSNAPIALQNPYIVLNACIAITGLFPPRN